MFVRLDQRVESYPLLLAELDDILLHGRLFRGRDASPAVAGRSIHYFSVLRKNPVRAVAPAIMNAASWPDRMNRAPISI